MEESASKFKEKLIVLSSRKSFKETVAGFREKWGIPHTGFKIGTNERNNWENKREAKDTRRARKAFKNKTVFTSDSNLYNEEFEAILKKFHLSERYSGPLRNFILFNDFEADVSNQITVSQEAHVSLSTIPDLASGKQRVFLEIFAETTTTDITKIWPMVEQQQKYATGYTGERYGNPLLTARNLMILDLHRKGMKSQEIATLVKKEFGIKSLSYNYVNTLIGRLRKRIKDSDTNDGLV